MKFDFNDILLVPETISDIYSRKEIRPYDENGMLPIMTAPMDTVIDKDNASKFIENKIYSVLPRNSSDSIPLLNNYKKWYSYGLDEFKEKFITSKSLHNIDDTHYALIDVANGHMRQLYDLVKDTKAIYGSRICLMIGNIANPNAYKQYAQLGVDYVRCGIGGGQGCLTSVQTGVGYPMASLINECYKIKIENEFTTKIIADGGFKGFSDINKALALGADYVMLGSMLNKCFESCGEFVVKHSLGGFGVGYGYNYSSVENYYNIRKSRHMSKTYTNEELMSQGILYKQFRGMSTKAVQKAWGHTELKTSEGISVFNKVEYTLSGFVENLEDYLRSAMSYCNAYDLTEFKESEFVLITPATYNRFNK